MGVKVSREGGKTIYYSLPGTMGGKVSKEGGGVDLSLLTGDLINKS